MKEKISKMLKSYFFDGFLLIALGVVMIVWPKQSVNYSVIESPSM